MTQDEIKVIELLADAWNAFVKLEVMHPDDALHFRTNIHAAQSIIMQRDAVRLHAGIFKQSRCCGRCDGVNDLCVTDMVCDEHNITGCEICFK